MIKTQRVNNGWAWVHTVGGLKCKKSGPGWTKEDEKKLWVWLNQCGGEKLFSRYSEERIPVEPGASFRSSLFFAFKDQEGK